MPRYRKPPGWPRYMEAKKLASGGTAYFWNVPTKFRKRDCPLKAEALGRDYGEAIKRVESLNCQLDAWRAGGPTKSVPAPGTLAWLVSEYRSQSKFRRLAASTQKHYLRSFDMVLLLRPHNLPRYERVGDLPLKLVTPAVADRIYERIAERSDGSPRIATANYAMRAMRRAWNVAKRAYPRTVPADNPFCRMELRNTRSPTRAATRKQLAEFVKAADTLGLDVIGTAALITFEWLLREADIITRLTWADYRPEERPDAIKLRHGKTQEEIWVPLEDDCGLLFPELTGRLDRMVKRGPLIIMHKKQIHGSSICAPYKADWFRNCVAKIRDHADLPRDITFTSFRHGGLTELGDAGISDQGMMALSAHKTRAMLTVYSKRNMRQRAAAARTRLSYRNQDNGT